MLVLARRENQTLLIGDEIKIRVVSIRGGNVRLAIEAPRELRIDREECVADRECAGK